MNAASQWLAEFEQAFQGKKLRTIPLRDFVRRERPPDLVDGLIEQGSLIGIVGRRKGGKSYAALDLAFAVAQGRQWAGADVVTPGPVLWVAAEGARSLQYNRGPQWQAHYGDAEIEVYPKTINLRNPEHIESLGESCVGMRLVVIDSLRRVTPGAKENASDELAPALTQLEQLALKTGATVCVIVHAGKADATSARGSSAIEDSLETIFAIEKVGDRYRMTMPIARDGESNDAPRFFGLKPIEPAGMSPGVIVDWTVLPVRKAAEVRGTNQRIALSVVQEMSGELKADVLAEIMKRADLKNNHANRALRELINKGAVRPFGDDGRVWLADDPAADFKGAES